MISRVGEGGNRQTHTRIDGQGRWEREEGGRGREGEWVVWWRGVAWRGREVVGGGGRWKGGRRREKRELIAYELHPSR